MVITINDDDDDDDNDDDEEDADDDDDDDDSSPCGDPHARKSRQVEGCLKTANESLRRD